MALGGVRGLSRNNGWRCEGDLLPATERVSLKKSLDCDERRD